MFLAQQLLAAFQLGLPFMIPLSAYSFFPRVIIFGALEACKLKFAIAACDDTTVAQRATLQPGHCFLTPVQRDWKWQLPADFEARALDSASTTHAVRTQFSFRKPFGVRSLQPPRPDIAGHDRGLRASTEHETGRVLAQHLRPSLPASHLG